MSFRIIKTKPKEQAHCNYVQKKIDLAAAKGMAYDLSDEDKRIEKLENNPELYRESKLSSIDRVLVDGQEKVVFNILHTFKDGEGNYVDKYFEKLGESLNPTVQKNPDTNVTSLVVNEIERDIDYTPDVLEKYMKDYKAENKTGLGGVKFRFYQGGTTEARTINGSIYECINYDYFKDATFEELQLGREQRFTSSMINHLADVRKQTGKGSFAEQKPVKEDNNDGKVTKEEEEDKEQAAKQKKNEEKSKTDDVEITANNATASSTKTASGDNKAKTK